MEEDDGDDDDDFSEIHKTFGKQNRHLATWARKTNGIPKPPQWDSQQNTIHHGNRRSRSPPISGHRHIQEDGLLPWAQSLSETHPHKPLPTPKIPSPSSQETLSPLVPGTQS